MSRPTRPPTRQPSYLAEHLQAVTEALAAAPTPTAVFEVVLGPALEALGAVGGTVLLVTGTGDALEVAATLGGTGQTVWQSGPLEPGVPAGDALARRAALYFEHAGDLTGAYPELEARTGGGAAVASAVLPMFLDDAPLGALVLDFPEPHSFTPDERHFLETLAAQCGVGLGRARLTLTLEDRVAERTRELEEERDALDAFSALTEAVGTETDVLAVARRAVEWLHGRYPGGTVGYYEPEGGRWKVRVYRGNLGEALAELLQTGLPGETPMIARALSTRQAVFDEAWNAEQQQIEHTEAYHVAAHLPLVVGGEVRGLLGLGLRDRERWTGRDRALIGAVGRGLTLALERADHLRQREEERGALDAFVAY